MNDLDTRIEKILKDASQSHNISDDPSELQEFLATFNDRYRFVMTAAWIKLVGIIGVMLLAIYQFFQQESVMAMIAWATIVIIAVVAIATIDMFIWIAMNRNNTIREIKRLELQVALLTSRLESQQRSNENGEPGQ